jgi:hypothetical protein
MSTPGSLRLWFRAQHSTFPWPTARRPVGPAYLIKHVQDQGPGQYGAGRGPFQGREDLQQQASERLIARVHSWVRSASNPESTFSAATLRVRLG